MCVCGDFAAATHTQRSPRGGSARGFWLDCRHATSMVANPSADALTDALAAATAAKDMQVQVKALKEAHGLMKGKTSVELLLPCAHLIEFLIRPRPFSVHAALKACISTCCADAACAAALRSGLALRLSDFFSSQSLWRQHQGALRELNGPVPGWLELLLDVPELHPLLRDEAPRLFHLLASSLLATRRTLEEDPANAEAGACAQEVGKLALLMLKLCDPVLRKRDVADILSHGGASWIGCSAPHNGMLLSFDAASPLPLVDSTGSAMASTDHLPADVEEQITMHLCMLCRDALGIVFSQRPSGSAFSDMSSLSTALVAGHLLCATLDAMLVTSAVVRHVQAFVKCAGACGASILAVSLRGAAQGTSTAVLTAPSSENDAACLLFGAVGGGIASLCDSSVEATLKLFAFRALEALLSHAEAVSAVLATRSDGSMRGASPDSASLHGECTVPALQAFLSKCVQLLFDNWELSFQSLTNMLQPLLKRLLKLEASLEAPIASDASGALPSWLAWLLPQLRQMDWTRRAKYRALQVTVSLVPRGTCTILRSWPTLFDECFAALAIPNYVSQCELLLADLMKSLNAHLLANSDGRLHDGESSEAAWSRIVISPLLMALRSATDRAAAGTTAGTAQTDAILHAALPSLLAAQPDALGWLLALVSENGEGLGGGLSIAVLRAARSAGLLSAESLAVHTSNASLMNGNL